MPSNAARAKIPASLLPIINLYPVTSNPDLGNGTAQFTASYSDPSNLDAYGIRIDHTLNSKMSLFGRYSAAPSSSSQRSPVGVLSNVRATVSRTRYITLGFTYFITPHLSNVLLANYSNTRAGNELSQDNFGGATPQDATALYQSLNFPTGATPNNATLSFNLPSVGLIAIGKTSLNEQRQANLVDTLAYVAGSHQLKGGIDYRYLAPFERTGTYQQNVGFSGVLGGAGTLQSGVASSVSISAFSESSTLVKNFSLFGQDIWKVTPRFTLTYGLRWEVNPAFKSKDPNRPYFTILDLNASSSTLALAPRGTPEYQTTRENWAPRVGVAYSLRQKPARETVIRGGFGLFYDLGSSFFEGNAGIGWPFSASLSLGSLAYPLTPAQAVPAPISSNPPVRGSLYTSVPNLKLPRTWEFNVALEQSLGSAQMVSLTYVGAIGRNLIYQNRLLPTGNANFVGATILVFSNLSSSDYHALQAKYQRRLSRGLQALASYTWTHSLDNLSDGSVNGTPQLIIPDLRVDRGNSDFDIRHSFSGAVVYDVPKPSSPLARAILGGWSLSGSMVARSAPPVNVLAASITINGLNYQPRPNVIPGVPFYLYGPQFAGGKIFNNTVPTAAQIAAAGCVTQTSTNARGAFCTPPSGTQGNFGRNVLRGFGAWQVDLSARRRFHLTERLGLEFSADIFNIFNHPSFNQPLGSIQSALFGQSTTTLASGLGNGVSGSFNPLYQLGGPRSIQLEMRLRF